MKSFDRFRIFAASLVIALCAGCASHRHQTDAVGAGSRVCPPPSTVRFKTFAATQIKGVECVHGRQLSDFEEKAIRMLNADLYYQLSGVLSPLETVPCAGEFRPASFRTLLIEPRIVDMHVVSPVDRYWFTWCAGDSVIRMQLVFRDSLSGEVIAQPTFYRRAPLWSATLDSGESDRELPDLLADDIRYYVQANR